jgi:hypothetical protein
MKLNICPAPQTVKFALSSPRLRTWCLANGVLAVQRGSIVQDRAFNYIKSYSTLSNFDAALIRISISLRHKTLAKNMAQGPRSARPHPLSDDQTPSNRINYFQTPSGPLRFFSFGVTACIGRITMQSDGYLSTATLPPRQFPSPNATVTGIAKFVVNYSLISSTELLYNVSLSMQR